jgi:tRNA modification GTPase
MEDTIAAISTPVGPGGIAIIRLSGPQALAVADLIFQNAHGRPSSFSTHTLHYGQIQHHGRVLDQVLLSVMRAPRSYTCEDVVEINCHGGLQTARSILECCVAQGARLAAPGEFTQRAFLNGRLDLTQAEAVMDLIQARTERAQAMANSALEGHLSKRLLTIQNQLISVLANIEAHIDFPEEDITPASLEQLQREITNIVKELTQLLATSREGQVLREGITITIIGRPNVGKSSLLNSLLGRDRAIVSPIAGTTRDVLEEVTSIRGIPVRLADTAGIRETRGLIETMGIHNTHKQLQISDIAIHVLDLSRSYSKADQLLAAKYANQAAIQVLHKSDQPVRLRLPADFPSVRQVRTSSVTGEGMEELSDAIEQAVLSDTREQHHADIAINTRQSDVLARSKELLECSLEQLRSRHAPELVSQNIRLALNAVDEVGGKTAPEEILNSIFSKFCIGK